MTAGEFEKKYPDVWKSFSDYTKQWFEDKMNERLDVAHGMAKHQLDTEHKKRMPRLQEVLSNLVDAQLL